LDESLSEGHGLLGEIYLWKKQHERAIGELEKAISLDPNNAELLSALGGILAWAGRPDEAVELIRKAMRLNPVYPAPYLWNLGHVYFLMEQYEQAVDVFIRALNLNPNFYPSNFYLAATYTELGWMDEARAQIEELMNKWPEGSLEEAKQRLPYRDQALMERLLDLQRKAGLK
jgi:adenylate cyclase